MDGLQPYPYQADAVSWMLDHRRSMLWADMGTGKTPMAALAMQEFPVLVVCPHYLKLQWLEEMQRWRPDLQTVIAGGLARHHKRAMALDADVVIANPESVRIKLGDFSRMRPQVLVLDESHDYRNRKSRALACVFSLAKLAKTCWLLTGNPIPRGPADLWPQLRMLDPARYTSFWSWADEHIEQVRNPWGTELRGWKPNSTIDACADGVMYRIHRELALPYLPPKTRETVHLEPTDAQRRAFRQIEDESAYVAGDGSLQFTPWEAQKQTRLLQAAVSPALIGASDTLDTPKFAYVLDQVQQHTPVIVYSKYVRALDLLHQYLAQHMPNLTIARQDGEHKQAMAFQEGFGDVLLGQMDTCRYGLNLWRSWRGIFLDCPWSWADLNQLEDRMMRPQQTQPVQTTILTTVSSKDEAVLEIVVEKRGYLTDLETQLSRWMVRDVDR